METVADKVADVEGDLADDKAKVDEDSNDDETRENAF